MADEGFKLGDAYVEVHMDTDKPVRDAAGRLRDSKGRFIKAGQELGDATGRGFGDGLGKSRGPVRESGRKLGKDAGDSAAKEVERQAPRITLAGSIMFGGLPAAAGAAGVATAAGLAGIPLIFGGIAAFALAKNQEVAQSFGELGRTVTADVKDMVAPLADDFEQVAQDATAAWKRSVPVFDQIFSNLGTGIDSVTDGLIGLAENALPGIADAAENSAPAFAGLESLLLATGTGVSHFFTNITHGSAGAGQVLTRLGGVVEHALGFAGELIAKLTKDGATGFSSFADALDSAEDSVLKLADGALPVLNATSMTMFGTISSLLRVLGPITPALGEVAGGAISAKIAFGAMNAVSFGGLTKSLNQVKANVSNASGFVNKASAAVSGLGTAGGIAGVAALGFGVVMSIMAAKAQAAAERQQRLTEATKELGDVLKRGIGTGTGDFLNSIYQSGQKIPGFSQRLKELGTNLSTASIAAQQGGRVFDDYRSSLDANIVTQKDFTKILALSAGQQGLDELRDSVLGAQKANVAYELSLRGVSATGLLPLDQHLLETVKNIGTADNATVAASKSSQLFQESMQLLASTTANADEKLQALMTVMDQYTGRTPNVEEATQAVNKDFRDLTSMTKEWTSNVKGSQIAVDRHGLSLKAWAASLINADGTINTTTESGSRFQDTVVQTTTDLYTQVTAMHENGASQQQLEARVLSARDAFIKQAQQMGFTRVQAEQLANKYGLIPDRVSTVISARDTASGVIASTLDDLHKLTSKTWIINLKTRGAGLSSARDWGMNAEGDDNWRGGPTSLAEKGFELIRVGTQWSVAAAPMVANLPTGAQIIPHEESQAMLSRQLMPVSTPSAGSNASLTGGGVTVINQISVPPGADLNAFAERVSWLVEKRLRRPR